MYLHDVGELIYFDDLLSRAWEKSSSSGTSTNSSEKDTTTTTTTSDFDENLVVLEPMWITRMFRAVMTRRDLTGNFQEPLRESEMMVPVGVTMRAGEWREAWEAFLREGRLKRRLVEEYLWKEVPRKVQEKALLLLDRLDLICPLLPFGQAKAQDFLVPCVPMHYWEDKEETAAGMDYDQTNLVKVCVLDFIGFLPDALVMRVLLWGVREGMWAPPKLRRMKAELKLLSLMSMPTVVMTVNPLEHKVAIFIIKLVESHNHRLHQAVVAKGIWRVIRGFCQCAVEWTGAKKQTPAEFRVVFDPDGGSVLQGEEITEERVMHELHDGSEEASGGGGGGTTATTNGTTTSSSYSSSPGRGVGLLQIGALALTNEDFVQVGVLGHGGCSASVELVECHKLYELGLGPLFARKLIYPEVFPTYEREVAVAQALESLGPDVQQFFCRVIYHTLGAPSGEVVVMESLMAMAVCSICAAVTTSSYRANYHCTCRCQLPNYYHHDYDHDCCWFHYHPLS